MHKLANVCVNKILMDVYGLRAETKLDYCVYADYPLYTLDAFFILSVAVICVLFILGGLYETFKENPKIKKFLEKWKKIRKFFQTYSIKHNWSRLVADDGKEDENLTTFYIAKVILLFCFIYHRVYQEITGIPFANPVNVEKVSF